MHVYISIKIKFRCVFLFCRGSKYVQLAAGLLENVHVKIQFSKNESSNLPSDLLAAQISRSEGMLQNPFQPTLILAWIFFVIKGSVPPTEVI